MDERVELARLTTIGTGGPARAFTQPGTVAELERALRWAAKRVHERLSDAGLVTGPGRLLWQRAGLI